MDDDTIKGIVAMGCITVLEVTALLLGHDGLMLFSALAALAGIAGYELKSILIKRKE